MCWLNSVIDLTLWFVLLLIKLVCGVLLVVACFYLIVAIFNWNCVLLYGLVWFDMFGCLFAWWLGWLVVAYWWFCWVAGVFVFVCLFCGCFRFGVVVGLFDCEFAVGLVLILFDWRCVCYYALWCMLFVTLLWFWFLLLWLDGLCYYLVLLLGFRICFVTWFVLICLFCDFTFGYWFLWLWLVLVCLWLGFTVFDWSFCFNSFCGCLLWLL